MQYFRARYGEGILLDPPFSGKTLLIWILPILAVGGGVWMILTRRRQDVSMEMS
ncbi:MAG: cytochrome c-type biogenesis protein CcmH [Acidimicrobiia bacterium]